MQKKAHTSSVLKSKKINLRLPSSLLHSFTQLARQRGVVKADLLRTWLTQDDQKLTITRKKLDSHQTSYSCVLTSDIYSKVVKMSEDYGISLNYYLTQVIQKNLLLNKSSSLLAKKQQVDFHYLWNKGWLGEVHGEYLNNFECLDVRSQYKLTFGELGRGDFPTTLALTEVMKATAIEQNNPQMIHRAHVLQAHLAIHSRRDVDQAQDLINQSWEFAQMTQDRELIGLLADARSTLAFYLEDIPSAHLWKEVALDYFDPIHHFDNFIDSLGDLMRFKAADNNWQQVAIIQKKSICFWLEQRIFI